MGHRRRGVPTFLTIWVKLRATRPFLKIGRDGGVVAPLEGVAERVEQVVLIVLELSVAGGEPPSPSKKAAPCFRILGG